MAARGAFALVIFVLLLSFSGSTCKGVRVPSKALPFQPAPLANGGFTCVWCTLLTDVILKYSYIHEQSISKTLEEICTFAPAEYRSVCDELVFLFGDSLIYWAAYGATADEVCQKMTLCNNPQCLLFSNSSSTTKNVNLMPPFAPPQQGPLNGIALLQKVALRHPAFANLIGGKKVNPRDDFNDHLPLIDDDYDKFSTFETFRGSCWRGKDCNDYLNTTYPGRKQPGFAGDSSDYNCNGIKGVNPKTGKLYKDELCSKSSPQGVVVFGASAQAHFEIPPQWIEPQYLNISTYSNFAFAASNELDWPHKSWVTGYASDEPWVNSIYLEMWRRNHCNFRDYQNIAVNGEGSGKLKDTVPTVSRNSQTDYPVLAFYATIGDDICSPHHDLDHMTTASEFYQNVMDALNYLDSGVFPAGSHVVFIGLVDGRILWDNLHNKLNPIGRTYEEVYDWLNCLGVNPCWQWLNSNATVRNIASARAAELSNVFQMIMSNHTFKHFDMAYYPFPLEEIIKKWEAKGGQVEQLIEPVDGFHPSQIGHYEMANVLWEDLVNDHPSFVGPVNPNNALIEQLFGNQGGY